VTPLRLRSGQALRDWVPFVGAYPGLTSLRLRPGLAPGYLMSLLRGWIVVVPANSRFLPFALRMVGMTRMWSGGVARARMYGTGGDHGVFE